MMICLSCPQRSVPLHMFTLWTTDLTSFSVSSSSPTPSTAPAASPPPLMNIPVWYICRFLSAVFGPVYGTQGAFTYGREPGGPSNWSAAVVPRAPGSVWQLGAGAVSRGSAGTQLLGGRVGRPAGGPGAHLRQHPKKGALFYFNFHHYVGSCGESLTWAVWWGWKSGEIFVSY